MMPAWAFVAWAAMAGPIANHLWQSTVFAMVAGLLTLTLTHHRAQLRYALWLAASVKFLVPFGALVTLGRHVGWPASIRVQPDMTLVLDVMSQPFSRPALRVAAATSPATAFPGGVALLFLFLVIWSCGCAVILLTWWVRWRRLAVVIREASLAQDGRELQTLRRLERIIGTARPVAMVSSNTSFEPGVFGLVRPVLLWPRSVGERLEDRQVEAILSHELAHVRRHDNLAAAVHMVVEVLFWFHPLVWWLGTRLVDERERACDEEVIRWGSEPQVYAESILRICELYAEVPLDCVAGVTGSDLKKRIERIMQNDARAALNAWRKILVVSAAVIAIVGPIALGALNAPRLRAQSLAVETGVPAFASVSIKTHPSGDTGVYPITAGPDGTSVWKGVTLRVLLRTAYGLPMSGGPEWLSTDRFDIETRAEGHPSDAQWPLMWRGLLAGRFNLIVHTDTRVAPVYALVFARSDGTLGPQIRPSACAGKDTTPIPGPLDPKNPPPLPCGAIRSRPGTLVARWATMEELASQMLSLMLGHKVIDRTGLTERYDLNAEWTPAPGPPGPQASGVGPATFTAIEEQLGLKLESEQGTVDTLVIDHVERPIANAAAASDAVQATAAAPVTAAPGEGEGRATARVPEPRRDNAVAETGASGLGFGLSTGGGPGTGSTLDVADFCCPKYLALMIERIRSGWTQQAEVAGIVVIRFTIERDGRITRTSVERTSGYQTLDIAARNAVTITRQLPPLPQAFSNPTLTVHLNFQYRR
jgi:bla regulator protein BlaR1